MQELVGRLTSLDPRASESLKVVTYFDKLVSGEVGIETIVRGAAVLSGVTAGVRHGPAILRVTESGERLNGGSPDGWPTATVLGADIVWIERDGPSHENDAMVLERFALAVAISRARRRTAGEDAVHIVTDAARARDERAAAASALNLPARVRAVATDVAGPAVAHGPATVIATPHGAIRAIVVSDDSLERSDIAGWGTWCSSAELPSSWVSAVMALRVARVRRVAVDAQELGVIGTAALALDGVHNPDVDAIARLTDRTRAVVRALVEADSMRAAAARLGMHHSSVQARHTALVNDLGYDPRTALGRARFELAELLYQLESTDRPGWLRRA